MEIEKYNKALEVTIKIKTLQSTKDLIQSADVVRIREGNNESPLTTESLNLARDPMIRGIINEVIKLEKEFKEL